MSVSLRTIGVEVLRRRLAGLTASVRGEVGVAMESVAEAVVAEIRKGLASDGPSRAGQKPADPSAALAASLDVVNEAETGRVSVTVASPYARFLEYGTRRMAARPFLRPAVDAMNEQARHEIAAAFTKAAGSLTGDDR